MGYLKTDVVIALCPRLQASFEILDKRCYQKFEIFFFSSYATQIKIVPKGQKDCNINTSISSTLGGEKESMDGQVHCIQSSLRVSNSILKGDLDIKNKQEVTF